MTRRRRRDRITRLSPERVNAKPPRNVVRRCSDLSGRNSGLRTADQCTSARTFTTANSAMEQIVFRAYARLGVRQSLSRSNTMSDRFRGPLLEGRRPAGRAGGLRLLPAQDLRRAEPGAARDRSLRSGLPRRRRGRRRARQDLSRASCGGIRLRGDRADQAAVRRGARRGPADLLFHRRHARREPARASSLPPSASGRRSIRPITPSGRNSSRSRATSSSPSSARACSTARR